MVLPALQVILAVISGCGTHSVSAARQVSSVLPERNRISKSVFSVGYGLPERSA